MQVRQKFTGFRRIDTSPNGCQMRIVREEELFKEICRQMRWKEVTEEKVEKIDRVEIREDGVEVVQRKNMEL